MSSATKIKLGILTLLLVLLGGNLLGDTVVQWRWGGPGTAIVNLPASTMMCLTTGNLNTTAAGANQTYSIGVRMDEIEAGIRLIPSTSMASGFFVLGMTAGVFLDVTAGEGEVVISGETLMFLRDNGVPSFSLMIFDTENYYEVKIVLTPFLQEYQVLIR